MISSCSMSLGVKRAGPTSNEGDQEELESAPPKSWWWKAVSKWLSDAPRRGARLDNVSLLVSKASFICLVVPRVCVIDALNINRGPGNTVIADRCWLTVNPSGSGARGMIMFQESALFPWLTSWITAVWPAAEAEFEEETSAGKSRSIISTLLAWRNS